MSQPFGALIAAALLRRPAARPAQATDTGNPCSSCGRDTGSDVMQYCGFGCSEDAVSRATKAADTKHPIARPPAPATHRPDPTATPSARLYYQQRGPGWI